MYLTGINNARIEVACVAYRSPTCEVVVLIVIQRRHTCELAPVSACIHTANLCSCTGGLSQDSLLSFTGWIRRARYARWGVVEVLSMRATACRTRRRRISSRLCRRARRSTLRCRYVPPIVLPLGGTRSWRRLRCVQQGAGGAPSAGWIPAPATLRTEMSCQAVPTLKAVEFLFYVCRIGSGPLRGSADQ